MLIHSTISRSIPHPQSISLSNSINFLPGFRNLSLINKPKFNSLIISNYSSSSSSSSSSFVSNVNYKSVDYEKKPGATVTWKAIYKRISMMGNREKGSSNVLNQWENEGKTVTKWELCRLVKELRKYGRYKLALEVFYLNFIAIKACFGLLIGS